MQSTFGNWGIPEYHFPFLSDGVTMFFVISGFLITYLLLEEQKRKIVWLTVGMAVMVVQFFFVSSLV